MVFEQLTWKMEKLTEVFIAPSQHYQCLTVVVFIVILIF